MSVDSFALNLVGFGFELVDFGTLFFGFEFGAERDGRELLSNGSKLLFKGVEALGDFLREWGIRGILVGEEHVRIELVCFHPFGEERVEVEFCEEGVA